MINYRSLKHWKYQLMTEYITTLQVRPEAPVSNPFLTFDVDGWLRIKKGYCWDGPSGPTIDTKSFMRGSLVHDVLYQLIREGHLPKTARQPADELLRQHCIEDGMSRFRAWYVYKSLRLFGGRAARPGRE